MLIFKSMFLRCGAGCVCSCAENLPVAVLLLFCSEGDNIPDAFALVNHLNDWLHLLDGQVILIEDVPVSVEE